LLRADERDAAGRESDGEAGDEQAPD